MACVFLLMLCKWYQIRCQNYSVKPRYSVKSLVLLKLELQQLLMVLMSAHSLFTCPRTSFVTINYNKHKYFLLLQRIDVFHWYDNTYSSFIGSVTSSDISHYWQRRQGLLCLPVPVWVAGTFCGGVHVPRLLCSAVLPAYHTHPSSCPTWCVTPHTAPCLTLHLPGREWVC